MPTRFPSQLQSMGWSISWVGKSHGSSAGQAPGAPRLGMLFKSALYLNPSLILEGLPTSHPALPVTGGMPFRALLPGQLQSEQLRLQSKIPLSPHTYERVPFWECICKSSLFIKSNKVSLANQLTSWLYTAAFTLASGHPGLEIKTLHYCPLYRTVR